MTHNIFKTVNLDTKIHIKSSEIDKNIDIILLNKLRNTFENKCNENGYILKDSIKILKRSNGYILDLYDPSLIYFDIFYSCNLCNPAQETLITCNVKENIKPGIIAYIHPLEIIIPIALHKNKEIFNTLKISDEIKVKILKIKIKLNEDHIQAVGILEDESDKISPKISTDIFEEPISKTEPLNEEKLDDLVESEDEEEDEGEDEEDEEDEDEDEEEEDEDEDEEDEDEDKEEKDEEEEDEKDALNKEDLDVNKEDIDSDIENDI